MSDYRITVSHCMELPDVGVSCDDRYPLRVPEFQPQAPEARPRVSSTWSPLDVFKLLLLPLTLTGCADPVDDTVSPTPGNGVTVIPPPEDTPMPTEAANCANDASPQEYCFDGDGDGYPGDLETHSFCPEEVPASYTSCDNVVDCNDTDATIHADAEELCDLIDNNCDEVVDENVKEVFYQDSDGDGFGDAHSSVEQCTLPNGYVENNNDCNDADAEINPEAAEVCDSIDNDCDGDTDLEDAEAGLASYTYYADSDGDGFGDAADSTTTCADTAPGNYVTDSSDCDDSNAIVYPGASEEFDAWDNDCDTEINNFSFDEREAFFTSTDPQLGIAMALCDFDGTGVANLIVGSPGASDNGSNSGSVLIFADAPLTSQSEPMAKIVGASNQLLGVSLACGALNGDAYRDLVIGTDNGSGIITATGYASPTGIVNITNPGTLFPVSGEQTGDRAGKSVAVADVDDDGFSDVYAAAPEYDKSQNPNSGKVYVIEGGEESPLFSSPKPTLATAATFYFSGSRDMQLGALLAQVGVRDVALGTVKGQVYIPLGAWLSEDDLSGGVPQADYGPVFVGSYDDGFGQAIAGNESGILFGLRYAANSEGEIDAGAAYVLNNDLPDYPIANQTSVAIDNPSYTTLIDEGVLGEGLGFSVANVGNVNKSGGIDYSLGSWTGALVYYDISNPDNSVYFAADASTDGVKVFAADLDADGDADLVFALQGKGEVYVYPNGY